MLATLIKRTFAPKLMRGDLVEIISGTLKGTRAKIAINRKSQEWVALESIKIKKRNISGKKISDYKKIPISKVALIDPVTDKKTRMHFVKEGNILQRHSADNNPIPYPSKEEYKYSANTKKVGGFINTTAENVSKNTYKGEDFFEIYKQFTSKLDYKKKIEEKLIFPENA